MSFSNVLKKIFKQNREGLEVKDSILQEPRDISKQSGFPRNIEWSEKSEI